MEPVARTGRRRAAPRCVVLAIDGSAGAGKSTTAAAVASRLGLRHLDSGAIYRAVTWAVLERARGAEGAERITREELEALDVALDWNEGALGVRIRGARVPERALRAPRVTASVSRVSAIPLVRSHLLELQRAAARPPGLVAEGRDMATVVFPNAHVKVYLDADVRERARRRIVQAVGDAPGPAEIDAEAARLTERDRLDSTRGIAPLTRADGAVAVDTTDLDPAAQTEAVVALALPFLRPRQ